MTDTVTPDFLAHLPKAELHVHLDGCLRPATMLDLAETYGVELPADEPEALAAYMLVDDAENLEDYLTRFQYSLAVLQWPDALERIAYEFVVDVAGEGLRYVEVRYCPALHMPALSLEQALEAPLAGLRRGETETGVVARVIVCGLRTLSPDSSLAMARAAGRYAADGVVAFDLAGSERGHPAADHAEAFRVARDSGVAVTCHAGEGDGPESIRQALDLCHAQRIGHGVRLREDPALEQRVRDAGVPLEMCVTSNVHTHIVPSAAHHPLRRYFDAGIPVTLNTDSRLMDGITLIDEYATAHTALGFGRADLERVALNAFEHAFLPDDEKRALLDEVRRDLAAMP